MIRSKIDPMGRILLPAQLRKQLEIQKGDYVESTIENNTIITRKVDNRCRICGEVKKRVSTIEGNIICLKCSNQIKKG